MNPKPPNHALRRALALVPVFAGLAIALAAHEASAVFTVELQWVSTTGAGQVGSSIIDARPGDELELDVIAHVDSVGVDSYQVSVAFDLNLLDELDLLEVTELEHVAQIPCDPLIEAQLGAFPLCFNDFGNELVNFNAGIEVEDESSPGVEGLAGGFEAGAPKIGPGEGVLDLSFRVGTLRFLVTGNVASNGDDLEGTLILEGERTDGYIDDSLGLIVLPEDLPSPDFVPGFAAVNVPEPAAGLLSLAALAAITGLRRSARLRVARPRT